MRQRFATDPFPKEAPAEVLLGRFSEGDLIEAFVEDEKISFRKVEVHEPEPVAA